MATKKKNSNKKSGLIKLLEGVVVLGTVAAVLMKFFSGKKKKK